MRLLLDTHALLWWLSGENGLSRSARSGIADDRNEVLVSAASAWEIATKHRLGKLPGAGLVARDVEAVLTEQGFTGLPISVRDANRAGRLPGPLRDPFDRMLIAQALIHDLLLVSDDAVFDRYGVAPISACG